MPLLHAMSELGYDLAEDTIGGPLPFDFANAPLGARLEHEHEHAL